MIVAGNADDSFASDAGVDLLGGADGGGAEAAAEVDTVGIGVEGDLGGSVDENAGGSADGADGLNDLRGEGLEVSEGQILFANLEVVDAAAGEIGGKADEMLTAGGIVSGEEAAIRDGIEQHLRNSVLVFGIAVIMTAGSRGTRRAAREFRVEGETRICFWSDPLVS